MNVLCKKDGYEDTAQVVAPDFQFMTLGNIIIGGLVGLVVDMSTGAINKYPGEVMVPLQPGSVAEQPVQAPIPASIPMS
jgi:hypothetical protein